jgi:hypothetical protein
MMSERDCFQITIYGNLVKINDTISQARARIFYKGGNRNGTYITEEFAQKLIGTLPYTPGKGIWDSTNNDFLDHGQSRDQGKIYGVVPDEAREDFRWKDFEDEDGITRTYATVNIYLYTGIY